MLQCSGRSISNAILLCNNPP